MSQVTIPIFQALQQHCGDYVRDVLIKDFAQLTSISHGFFSPVLTHLEQIYMRNNSAYKNINSQLFRGKIIHDALKPSWSVVSASEHRFLTVLTAESIHLSAGRKNNYSKASIYKSLLAAMFSAQNKIALSPWWRIHLIIISEVTFFWPLRSLSLA